MAGIFWYLNWSLEGVRTHWCFFPLWFGFILTVDGLVYKRKGHSLYSRSKFKFIGLFLLSAPVWWLFEAINIRTQYWSYEGRNLFTDLEFFLYSSLNFSTVIPAMFESAELAGSLTSVRRMKRFLKLPKTGSLLPLMFFSGWVMLALVLIWPEIFVPFIWISIYFIIEPVNGWLGYPTLLDHASNGDWRPVVALFIGSLICGFFWEMWNYYAFPKWIYHIPIWNFWHLFEMPLLGYLGYLPFALELYAIYQLVNGILRKSDGEEFLHIID